MNYYIYTNDAIQGPLSSSDLESMLTLGAISPLTPATFEGEATWSTVKQVLARGRSSHPGISDSKSKVNPKEFMSHRSGMRLAGIGFVLFAIFLGVMNWGGFRKSWETLLNGRDSVVDGSSPKIRRDASGKAFRNEDDPIVKQYLDQARDAGHPIRAEDIMWSNFDKLIYYDFVENNNGTITLVYTNEVTIPARYIRILSNDSVRRYPRCCVDIESALNDQVLTIDLVPKEIQSSFLRASDGKYVDTYLADARADARKRYQRWIEANLKPQKGNRLAPWPPETNSK
jgi:hypothetical protein